ncbi:MAG: serine/threonine protein kinase, partial [Verrucomicrobiota bacterium]
MNPTILLLAVVGVGTLSLVHAESHDWMRFRGPNGSGQSLESLPLPTRWDSKTNMKWQVELPGPGHS